jgi:hypothetical protein
VRACCFDLDAEYDLTDAIQYASEILFRLSGRQWPGVCERTLYPCSGNNCGCGANTWSWLRASDWNWVYAGFPSVPYRFADGWVNVWGTCRGGCNIDCFSLPGIVNEVTQIVIDGEVLDPSAYKVEAYRKVCRMDNLNWPCSNNLGGKHCVNTGEVVTVDITADGGTWDLIVLDVPMPGSLTLGATDSAAAVQAACDATWGANTVAVSGGPGSLVGGSYLLAFDLDTFGDTISVQVDALSLTSSDPDVDPSGTLEVVTEACRASEGTWSVSYLQGAEPPLGGQLAAAMFACQIALNRCGSDGCVLPQRLKQITREGVSMDFADPLEFLDRGEVGIYEVDLWLKSVNPNRIQRRAAVYRADSRKPPTNWT